MVRKEVALGIMNNFISSHEFGVYPQYLQWYEKDQGLSEQISQQPDIHARKGGNEKELPSPTLILENDLQRPPTKMLGLGTSLDGATVHHLMSMTSEQRKNFLTTLIDPINGAGFTQFRLVIGTSDLNAVEQELFSYYDKIPEGEPNWELDFSIYQDIQSGLLTIIREIFSIATSFDILEEIKFLASPWSPPGWMKERHAETGEVNNDLKLIGGYFKDDQLDNWAIYLRRYVEEYAKLGIPIHSLTLQNEPSLPNRTYPSGVQTGEQQAKVALKLRTELDNSPIIQSSGYYTELWAWDYGTDEFLAGLPTDPEFTVDEFLEGLEKVDPGLTSLNGIAFHGYNYTSLLQGKIKKISELYPQKGIHLTEAMEIGSLGANRLIINLRQNCSSYYHWVTCLDQEGRPNEWQNSPHIAPDAKWNKLNLALAIYDGSDYWFPSTINTIGQIARFVRPDCEMIITKNLYDPEEYPETWVHYVGVEHILYLDNNNNNKILIISNNRNTPTHLAVPSQNGKHFIITVQPKQMGTYVYSANN